MLRIHQFLIVVSLLLTSILAIQFRHNTKESLSNPHLVVGDHAQRSSELQSSNSGKMNMASVLEDNHGGNLILKYTKISRFLCPKKIGNFRS